MSGVGKGDFFSVVIIAFVCCDALGRFRLTWKQFDYFIVILLRLGSLPFRLFEAITYSPIIV